MPSALFTVSPDSPAAIELDRLSRHFGERTVLHVGVGDLIGWAGDFEIRSPFSGTLEGIIVLEGERVVGGQPVAWLRADQEE